MAVAEACRNITCSGGRPLAATNCLNFGNPEHPEVMWQFSEVIDGISEACTFFGAPITGGNVSFYNETFGEDIYPTPVLGLVGLIEDISFVTTSSFDQSGDSIVLVETLSQSTGNVNLDDERTIQNFISTAIRDKLVCSAHDVSEGGLAVALAECCYSNIRRDALGVELRIPSNLGRVKDLFGESVTRIVLSTRNAPELIRRARSAGLNCSDLGVVGGRRLTLSYEGERVIDIGVDELESIWRQALPALMAEK